MSSGFTGNNKGVTPSVAAPGVTHRSDATEVHVKLPTLLVQLASALQPPLFVAHWSISALSRKSNDYMVLHISNNKRTYLPMHYLPL